MEIALKNAQKKHLPLKAKLAKTLKIKISEAIAYDDYCLAEMKKERKRVF